MRCSKCITLLIPWCDDYTQAPVAAKAQEAGSASLAKTPAKKTPAKKTPAKKTPAKKTPVKKAPLKKDVVSTSTTSSKAIENSKGSVKAAVKKGTPVMKKKGKLCCIHTYVC